MNLKVLEWVKISGRGWIAVVENPYECEDFKHFTNPDVTLDDLPYVIIGVESYTYGLPYRAGHRLGLLIRGEPKNIDKSFPSKEFRVGEAISDTEVKLDSVRLDGIEVNESRVTSISINYDVCYKCHRSLEENKK